MRTLQSPRMYRIAAVNCGRSPTGHWRQQSASPQRVHFAQKKSIFHPQKVATLTTPQFETSVLLCGTSASLHDIGSDARGKKNRLLDTAQHLAQREVSIFRVF